LGDGVRVLTRIMKKVTAVAGKAGTQMRDRSRTAKVKVLAVARASRNKTEQGRQKMKNAYLKLLAITSRVAGQAKKFSREVAGRIKRGNLSVLHKAKRRALESIVAKPNLKTNGNAVPGELAVQAVEVPAPRMSPIVN